MGTKRQIMQFAYRSEEEDEIHIVDKATTQQEAIDTLDEMIKDGDISLGHDEAVFLYKLELVNEFVVKLQQKVSKIKEYGEE